MASRILIKFIFCLFINFLHANVPLPVSYLDRPIRVGLETNVIWFQNSNQYYHPNQTNYWYYSSIVKSKNLPMVRVDFGIFKDPVSFEWIDGSEMSFLDRTLTRPLFSELHYTTPKIFRLGLQFAAGTLGPNGGSEVYNAVIHDSNFPCNDADLGSLKAWAHNGRQIMYSVYFDQTISDTAYVFVNVNDDICEYHVKFDQFERDADPAKFKRFKGIHLKAPEGYKIVHPFMSVDSAMSTLNVMVVNLEGPVEVKLMSYRFSSDGDGKPLKWEKYDYADDLLPHFRNQKFYGKDAKNQEYDFHSLNFLRDYDFRSDYGNCSHELNPILSSFDCVHFFSAHYHGYEVYDLIGRPARKMPCKQFDFYMAKGIMRNAMYLERGRCKNSKVQLY